MPSPTKQFLKTGLIYPALLTLLILCTPSIPAAEAEATPEAEPTDAAEQTPEEEAPAVELNKDPALLAKAIQNWFDAHTVERMPKDEPEEEASEKKDGEESKKKSKSKKKARWKPLPAEEGAALLIKSLKETQHPRFVEAIKRNSTLLYRAYNVALLNEIRVEEMEDQLEELRPKRYKYIKIKSRKKKVNLSGGSVGKKSANSMVGGYTKKVKNKKVFKQVKKIEERQRERRGRQRDLDPLLGLLIQRVTRNPKPIDTEENLDRYTAAALEVDAADLLQELLDRGVKANDTISRMPLISIAIREHSKGCFALLLKLNADLTVVDSYGYMPLHHAVEQGMHKMVKDLIAAGADPTARTRSGRDPLQLADDDDRKTRAIFDAQIAAEIEAEEEAERLEKEKKRKAWEARKKKKKK